MSDNPLIKIPEEPWTNSFFNNMPERMTSGNAGAYFCLIPGLAFDTLAQLNFDALVQRWIKLGKSVSKDSILKLIGAEFGMPQFESETNDAYRIRLAGKWEYVRTYGTQDKLRVMLEQALSGSYTTGVVTDLEGEDVAVARPKNAGIAIQPYPSTTEYRLQFKVVFYLNEVLGSGDYSNLITDYQMGLIKEIIRLVKPVQWACREIVLIYNPTNSDARWNNGTSTWDGTAVWDAPAIGFVMERHSYISSL